MTPLGQFYHRDPFTMSADAMSDVGDSTDNEDVEYVGHTKLHKPDDSTNARAEAIDKLVKVVTKVLHIDATAALDLVVSHLRFIPSRKPHSYKFEHISGKLRPFMSLKQAAEYLLAHQPSSAEEPTVEESVVEDPPQLALQWLDQLQNSIQLVADSVGQVDMLPAPVVEVIKGISVKAADLSLETKKQLHDLRRHLYEKKPLHEVLQPWAFPKAVRESRAVSFLVGIFVCFVQCCAFPSMWYVFIQGLMWAYGLLSDVEAQKFECLEDAEKSKFKRKMSLLLHPDKVRLVVWLYTKV